MSFTTPKTNWALTNTDGSKQYFNIEDYARIAGNIQAAWDFATGVRYELGVPLTMPTLGYPDIPAAAVFNAVEENLEHLADKTYKPADYTDGRIFAGDGNDRTWTYDELNRIEGLTGEIYDGLGKADAMTQYLGQPDFYLGDLYL